MAHIEPKKLQSVNILLLGNSKKNNLLQLTFIIALKLWFPDREGEESEHFNTLIARINICEVLDFIF